ncbi:MAG: hypothetical protein ACM3RX_05320 [Methanococcaceae archaeon]
MKNKIKTARNILILWYALFQAVHLIFLLKAGYVVLTKLKFTFPASPPERGWNPQSALFLICMGGIDFIVILLSFLFFFSFLRKKSYTFRLGVINLSQMVYSAFFFGAATFACGAWYTHPYEYLGMATAFIPVFILFLLYCFSPAQDIGTS